VKWCSTAWTTAWPLYRAAQEEAMAKKEKGSKTAKKLIKKVKKGVNKEKKKNIEIDRSDVRPPSPFSS
jgi:hypothetical protein